MIINLLVKLKINKQITDYQFVARISEDSNVDDEGNTTYYLVLENRAGEELKVKNRQSQEVQDYIVGLFYLVYQKQQENPNYFPRDNSKHFINNT